ncbi:fibronectin type III domain-containing protein [Pseudohaliea sp.]|uniref:fibronectin type III domain-containing protein n=1 Tax=Pseudohaliea sp. TaxID=2740289 RepID=UPI0032EE46BE
MANVDIGLGSVDNRPGSDVSRDCATGQISFDIVAQPEVGFANNIRIWKRNRTLGLKGQKNWTIVQRNDCRFPRSVAPFDGDGPFGPPPDPDEMYVSDCSINQDFVDNNAPAQFSFGYRVRQCSASGNCLRSYETVVPACSDSNSAGNSLEVGKVSLDSNANGVVISWPSVPGASAYRIQKKLPGRSFTFLTRVTDVSFLDTGIALKGVREYRVKACDQGQCGAWSKPASIDLSNEGSGGRVPDRPGPVSAALGANQSILVTWAQKDNAGSYAVFRREDGGKMSRVAKKPGPAEFIDNAVKGDSTYSYYVRACNSSGCGKFAGPSNAVTVLANSNEGTDGAQTLAKWIEDCESSPIDEGFVRKLSASRQYRVANTEGVFANSRVNVGFASFDLSLEYVKDASETSQSIDGYVYSTVSDFRPEVPGFATERFELELWLRELNIPDSTIDCVPRWQYDKDGPKDPERQCIFGSFERTAMGEPSDIDIRGDTFDLEFELVGRCDFTRGAVQ